MNAIRDLLLVFQILVCVGLVGVILLQRSEGGALGMGGGGGGFMTARGAGNLLTRTTGILAIIFFLLSIGLTILGNMQRSATITDKLGAAATAAAPLTTSTASSAASAPTSAPQKAPSLSDLGQPVLNPTAPAAKKAAPVAPSGGFSSGITPFGAPSSPASGPASK